MIRAVLLLVSLAAHSLAAQAKPPKHPTSHQRLPIVKDAPKPDTTHAMFRTDTIRDTLTVFTPPSIVYRDVAAEPVTDTLTRTRWVPLPIPIFWHSTRQSASLASPQPIVCQSIVSVVENTPVTLQFTTAVAWNVFAPVTWYSVVSVYSPTFSTINNSQITNSTIWNSVTNVSTVTNTTSQTFVSRGGEREHRGSHDVTSTPEPSAFVALGLVVRRKRNEAPFIQSEKPS